MTPTAHQGEEGFTLIEVAVALAILAMSITLLFAIFSESLARERKNEYRENERALAQSLLQRALDTPMKDDSGTTDDGLVWQVRYVGFGSQDDTRSWQHSAWQVTVSVTSNGAPNDRVTVKTLRLGRKEPLE